MSDQETIVMSFSDSEDDRKPKRTKRTSARASNMAPTFSTPVKKHAAIVHDTPYGPMPSTQPHRSAGKALYSDATEDPDVTAAALTLMEMSRGLATSGPAAQEMQVRNAADGQSLGSYMDYGPASTRMLTRRAATTHRGQTSQEYEAASNDPQLQHVAMPYPVPTLTTIRSHFPLTNKPPVFHPPATCRSAPELTAAAKMGIEYPFSRLADQPPRAFVHTGPMSYMRTRLPDNQVPPQPSNTESATEYDAFSEAEFAARRKQVNELFPDDADLNEEDTSPTRRPTTLEVVDIINNQMEPDYLLNRPSAMSKTKTGQWTDHYIRRGK